MSEPSQTSATPTPLQTSAIRQDTAWTLVVTGIALFLVGFGNDLKEAHSWADVWTPDFIGTTLVQFGGVLIAVFGAKKLRP